MKKLISVWLVLFFIILNPIYGQLISSVPPGLVGGPYDILPLKQGAVAINIDLSERVIHCIFTDEDLRKKNEEKFSFAEFVHKINYKVKDDKIYVLFNWDEARNYQKIFMTIDANTGETTFLPVPNSLMTYIDDFFILENAIAMIGFFKADQSLVQFIKYQNNNKELSTVHLQMKILDMAESDGYLDILAISPNVHGDHKLQLVTLNEEGERLYTIEADTQFEENHIIKSVILQKNGEGKFRAVGTYSSSKKTHFSGFFYWDMNYSLDQNFAMYPTSSLAGFEKGINKKLNRQIKHEMTKGFGIVKVLSENGQLAIVSTPNLGAQYLKRYPRLFNNSLFHVLYLNEFGEKISDGTFAYKRSLKSPYVDYNFLKNPPMYLVNGNIYFLYNEEFTTSPSLIIHNLESNAKKAAEELYPSIPQTSFYKTQHLKDNEVIVYGLKETNSKEKILFMDKVLLKPDIFR